MQSDDGKRDKDNQLTQKITCIVGKNEGGRVGSDDGKLYRWSIQGGRSEVTDCDGQNILRFLLTRSHQLVSSYLQQSSNESTPLCWQWHTHRHNSQMLTPSYASPPTVALFTHCWSVRVSFQLVPIILLDYIFSLLIYHCIYGFYSVARLFSYVGVALVLFSSLGLVRNKMSNEEVCDSWETLIDQVDVSIVYIIRFNSPHLSPNCLHRKFKSSRRKRIRRT